MRSRVASASPMDSSVNSRPLGPSARAPRFTQRAASGTSVVTTMSPAPARSAIQSSAASKPPSTRTARTFGCSGTRSVLFATTCTARP